MTPNPNPSPELKGCPFCQSSDAEMRPMPTQDKNGSFVICVACSALGPTRRDRCAAIAAWNTRALSQTLPAPGEVERPLDRNDLYRFMDTLKLSEKREVASAIGFDPAYVPGERDFDRWKRMWLWAAENDKKLALAAAIRSLLPAEALATVAAANDEGVARAGAALVEAWNSDGDGFSNTLPPIEFSEAELSHLVRAVLWSQRGVS